MSKHYQILYSGVSSTVSTLFLASGTTEEQAIAQARDYKNDLWRGFIGLREVRDIDISVIPPVVPSE